MTLHRSLRLAALGGTLVLALACGRARSPVALAQCRGDESCAEWFDECMTDTVSTSYEDHKRIDDACVNLGMWSDARRNDALAMKALERACRRGSKTGCQALGSFAKRLGQDQAPVEQREQALTLLELACSGGSPTACQDSAALYEAGLGTPERALASYARGCKRGVAESCYSLGRLHADGPDQVRNETEARRAFAQACDKDHTQACLALGSRLEASSQPFEAAAIYDRVCTRGQTEGCKKLALLEADNPAVTRYLEGERRRAQERRDAAEHAERMRTMREMERQAQAAAEAERQRAAAAEQALQEQRRAEEQRERERRAAAALQWGMHAAGQHLPQPEPRSVHVNRRSQSTSLCYDHDCNGVRTGKKCFGDKQAYCASVCAESDCTSRMVCESQCR